MTDQSRRRLSAIAISVPILTSALQTLKDHEIARGSTLMNITQQIAASIGTALFSVLLTNSVNGNRSIGAAFVSWTGPAAVADVPRQVVDAGLAAGAGAFGHAFLIGAVLVALCLVPAFFLPREKPKEIDPAAMVGH